eukprot:2196336-Rhodomonas_salina.1
MPCPVGHYAVSGSVLCHVQHWPRRGWYMLRARYAMSGTDLGYCEQKGAGGGGQREGSQDAPGLRVPYAISGTELAYGATRRGVGGGGVRRRRGRSMWVQVEGGFDAVLIQSKAAMKR